MKRLLILPEKISIYNLCWLIFSLIISSIHLDAYALEEREALGTLLVGAAEFPPFSMKNEAGRWEGFSIELWEIVAKELGVEFEIREYEWLRQIRDAIQNEELDLTTVMHVTEHNETVTDLSHSFYSSGLGIATGIEHRGYNWLGLVERFMTIDTLRVIFLLILMSLIAGMLVWIFERRENREMFGRGLVKGLGHGIWWAMVTMTTVGYGDKAPKTIGGRMIAVIWMFFSIILIANYTAVITTSLTLGELSGRISSPRDLPDVRVGSLAQSETLENLMALGIPVRPFADLHEGLQAVVENKIDAFVDDESELRYLVKTDFPGQLRVLAETFNHYYMSMAMPTGSPLREPLNRSLARVLEGDDWKRLKERYMGKSH